MPHELTENKKHCHFEVSAFLFLCNNTNHFSHQIVIYNTKWILYDSWWQLAQWLNREEAPKHFPKPNLAKKGHGPCLVACCPSDSFQLSESWRNHYIWEVCLADRWDVLKTATGWAQFFCMIIPDSTSHNQHFRSWTNWSMKFCLIHHIHLISCQPLLWASWQCFAVKMVPQPAAENASKSSSNPEAQIFILQ